MPNYSAGSASVDIGPNFEEFISQLREDLDRVDEKLDVKIRPGSISEFADQLEAELKRVDASVPVGIRPGSITEFADLLEAELKRVHADTDVGIRPGSITEFADLLEIELERVAADFHVKIRPGSIAEFADLLEIELKRVNADVHVKIRPGSITEFADLLEAELKRADASVHVKIRPGSIAEFADLLEIELKRVDASVPVALLPNFDRGAFEADLATFHPRIDAGILPMLDRAHAEYVDAQLDHIARTRFAAMVPTLDQSAAAAIEALLNHLARTRTADIDVNSRGLSGVSGAANNATRSLTAMSAVKFIGLAAGITALIPIILGAAGAAGGLLAIFGALGGAGAIGGSGIIGAFSAMKDASAGAGQAAVQHANDLNAVTDAQQRVIDSQHNEMDSLQRVKDAQKSLTQARVDAKDAMDNLNLSVKNGVLTERGAELSYRRAVVNLQKVRQQAARGQATGLDVETAQLEVDQAAQNITNVRVGNEQTKVKATDANSKGIEGSDQVVAAQQQLAQAQYGVQQAQIQTAQAIRELAKVQADAAKSANEAAGYTDKLAQAMAKLSPSAREFVLAMQALGPQWTELRKAVQQNLFSGLGDSMTQLANHQLPALKAGLSQLATGMNSAIRETLSSLDALFSKLVANNTMQAFIDGVSQAMKGMAPLITGLVSAFIQLGAAIGSHLAPFFTALGGAIDKIAGPLGQIGGAFIDTLTSILPTLADLISALSTGLAPVLPVVGQLLKAIGQALIPLIGPFSQITQIIGKALTEAITAIAPSLPIIAQAFADVLQAVAPLVKPLAEIFAIIAGAIAQNISALAVALAPVVKAFADGLAPVIPILADAFKQLTPVFAQMAKILGDALLEALQKIMPELPGLVKAFVDLLVALAPLLPVLVDLAVQVLPVLADILVAISPHVLQMLEDFTKFVTFVVSVLVPALEWWKTTMIGAWDKIKGIWSEMKQSLQDLHDKFADIIAKIKKLWDGLTEIFKSGVIGGVAGKVIDKALDLIPGHAGGGAISGPGTATSDSILARVSDGEYIVNAAATRKYAPLIEAINSDALPRFAAGGAADANKLPSPQSSSPQQSAPTGTFGSDIDKGLWTIIHAKFPTATLNSAYRPGDSGFHGIGEAVDIGGPLSDVANYAFGFKDQLAQIIYSGGPLWYNVRKNQLGNGVATADGSQAASIYGAKTVSQHGNHVHLAAEYAVTGPAGSAPATAPTSPTSPTSPSTPISPEAAKDPSNYSPTGTYIGPSSVDTSKDTQQAKQEGLPVEYSLQGVFSKAGSILATGLLSAFGLENSVLSSSNVYNRALNTTVDYYTKQNQDAADTVPTGTSTEAPGNPGTVTAPAAPGAPTKHAYDPQGGSEQWRGTVIGVLQGTGRDKALADRTLAQIKIESGGNPNARNETAAGIAAGLPIGLLQVIKTTFDANVDPRYPGTQTDPEANIGAAYNYVDKRYKGADHIWPTTAGYADGGPVSGPGNGTSDSILARLSHGEFVVNSAAAAQNSGWLHAINSGTSLQAPALPAGLAVRGGDTRMTRDHSVNFHGGLSVMDPQELVREQDRWVTQQSMGALAAYA